MSQHDFNDAARTDPVLKTLLLRLKETPHHFRMVFTQRGAPPSEQQQELARLVSSSKNYERLIAENPTFPDRANWEARVAALSGDIEAKTRALNERRNALAEESVNRLPLAALGMRREDFVRDTKNFSDRIAFDVTATLDAALALQMPDDAQDGVYVQLMAYNADAFPADIAPVRESLARHFAVLVAYLDSLDVPGRHLSRSLRDANAPGGFISQLTSAADGQALGRAIVTQHRPDYRNRDGLKHLDFHFVRALLAARAAWAEDAAARRLFDDLDFFLTQPGRPSSGLRGDCFEQDCVGYLSGLYEQDLPALNNAKLPHALQISLAESEREKIAQDVRLAIDPDGAKTARMKDLQNLARGRQNDPDFTESFKAWQAEYQALDAEAGDRVRSKLEREKQDAFLDAAYAQIESNILSLIQSGKTSMDAATDLKKDPTNYSSAREILLRATAADIAAVKALPGLDTVWIRREQQSWAFVHGVNGTALLNNPWAGDIPGIKSFAPHVRTLEATHQTTPAHVPKVTL